ncbi:MAG: hypothetical protein ACI8P3_002646, partial [Saprospiraceae bacterium]
LGTDSLIQSPVTGQSIIAGSVSRKNTYLTIEFTTKNAKKTQRV